MHVLAVLLDDVVHRRRVPRRGFGRLLLAEIDAELVLVGRGAALLVGRPSVGLVAAADDAVVADDVEFLRVLRDDRKPVDLTLISHCFLPLEHVGQPPVQKLVDAFGIDVAVGVDAQYVLREVLRGLAPDLLAAGFAVEARIVTGAVQGAVGFVVGERKALVRADGREADDVAVRPDTVGTRLPSLSSTPGASASG